MTPTELRVVPLKEQPVEALRLLAEYEAEFPEEHRDWLSAALAAMREEVRAGTAQGALAWGPHDEAVGIALWRDVERLGRRVADLYLAPGFRSGNALGAFVDAIDPAPSSRPLGAKVIALPAILPGIDEATQERVLTPRGFVGQSRLAMRRSLASPLDGPSPLSPGAPLRPVVEDDGMWVVRLYREAFERSVDRFWVDHGDLDEDARRLWKDLLESRWGPWLSFASYTRDRPGGLEGVSLVSHPKGRCPLLLELMVGPPFQGRGLGRALLARTLRALREHEIEELELNVVRENASAFHLYSAMGFAPVPGTEVRFWVRPGALG